MNLRRICSCFLFALCAFGASISPATEIDADVKDLLQKTADFLLKSEGFYVNLDSDVRTKGADGTENRVFTQLQIAARPPNLYARYIREAGVLRNCVISDGKSLYHYAQDFDAWDEKPAPASLQELLYNDNLAKATIASMLMTNKGYDALVDGITAAHMAEDRVVGGATYKVVAFEEANGSGEMVITTGDEPLLREYRYETDKYKVAMIYNKWDVRPDIQEQLFSFKPDEDARKVPSVDDLIKQLQPLETPAAFELSSEKAPDISLKQLSGESFKLSKFQGKDAVILVFWDTHSRNSAMMLRSVNELTEGLEGKGIVYYSVAVRDTEDRVRTYMKKEKRQFLVVMDPKGETIEPYKIREIPEIILMDKDGIIRAIHVGVTAKEILTAEINAVLEEVPIPTFQPPK